MAILNSADREWEKQVIDLNGPQGNAFFLLGKAKNLCKQIGISKDMTDSILDDMQSSDYEHLINVFDDNFGRLVDLER